MDEDDLFWFKWIGGIIGALLFIFIGYLLNPDDFTTVLIILFGAIILGITLNQWGKADVYR